MIPTFQSGDTIERTLTSVLAQEYRPLEVLVYDECSKDSTREVVERLLAAARSAVDAVRAALARVETEMLRDHLSHCIESAIVAGGL